MPNYRKNKEIRFRVNEELYNKIAGFAEAEGKDMADICREVLKKHLINQSVVDVLDAMLPVITKASRKAIEPSIERLAKIEAKGSIASATAMYMLFQVLHEMGKDPKRYYEDARKKAVQHLSTSADPEGF